MIRVELLPNSGVAEADRILQDGSGATGSWDALQELVRRARANPLIKICFYRPSGPLYTLDEMEVAIRQNIEVRPAK